MKNRKPEPGAGLDPEAILRDALAFQDEAARRAMHLAQTHLIQGRQLQAALHAIAARNRRVVA